MLLDSSSYAHVRTPSHWRGQRINDADVQQSSLCGQPVTSRDVTVTDAVKMKPDQVGEYNVCPQCLERADRMVRDRKARR